MNTLSAFIRATANRGKQKMVFDWDKCARLIREAKPRMAAAGLQGDWEWTGGMIYEDGKPVPADETYTFLASPWAIPEIEMDGVRQDCFRMENEVRSWDAKTYWPDSARAALALGQEEDDG